MQEQAVAWVYSPIRFSQLEAMIEIRLHAKGGFQDWTAFTLHSVTGFRLPGGGFQLEQISGYCHFRNRLKQYTIEKIEALRDAGTKLPIDDLKQWLASYQPPETVRIAEAVEQLKTSIAAGVALRRDRSLVARKISAAIARATHYGLDDIAERLDGILGTLQDRKLPEHHGPAPVFGQSSSFYQDKP